MADGAPALAAGDAPGFLNAIARRAAPPPEARAGPGRREPEPAPPPGARGRPRPAAAAGGPLPVTVRDAFRAQASICAGMGSPFTARLCRLVADRLAPGDPVSDRVLGWPGDPSRRADALPLRLAGALHGLVVEGRDAGLAAVYPPHHAAAGDDALWAAVGRRLRRARAVDARPPRRPAADQRDRSAAPRSPRAS